MKKFGIKLRNMAISFACLAVTAASASCEPAEEPGPDAPAFVEFSFANQRGTSDIDAKKRTVKAVAECGTNIASLAPEFKLSPEGTTATVDGKAQESGKTAHNFTDAVVYTLTTPDGETAEWTVTVTLPDDCPTVKKYITYNKPVTAYFVEYNGGAIDANKGTNSLTDAQKWGRGNPIIEAYENKKYSAIYWGGDFIYYEKMCWVIEAFAANGTTMYSEYGNKQWYTDSESADPDHDNSIDWRTEEYIGYEYPLGKFAAWVSAYKGHPQNFLKCQYSLKEIAQNPDIFALPNQTDVTKLYVKGETVCGIVCDVYKDTFDTYEYTFWVDPATGFTLKFEQRSTSDNSIIDSYEVTKLEVGKPKWDELHLHFRDGDTLTNIHQ
jgi:hypothetical protein